MTDDNPLIVLIVATMCLGCVVGGVFAPPLDFVAAFLAGTIAPTALRWLADLGRW